MLLLALYLAGFAYIVDRLDFLDAWGRVKKSRVDRLEKGICDEP